MLLPGNRILIGILDNKINNPPLRAHIDIDAKCNLKCEYCWFHNPSNKIQSRVRSTPFSLVKKAISDLGDLGVASIIISSPGEPWLYPHIIEAIRLIKKKKIKLTINTNLTFDNIKIRNAFATADSLNINFSCIDKNLYQRVQSPADPYSYNRLVSNLNFLSKLYNKTRKPELGITYVITPNNYAFIEKMINLAKDFSIKKINFKLMEPAKSTRKLFLGPKDTLILKKNIKNILKNPPGIDNNLDWIYKTITAADKSKAVIKRCFIPWLTVIIHPNGNVALCCKNKMLTVGNILHKSLKRIWFSKKADRLRLKGKYLFNARDPLWKVCEFCPFQIENSKIDTKLNTLQYILKKDENSI